jgi:KRAB domain-containing zinc finger protein
VHEGKKPFPCSQCESQFYFSTRLKEHIEKVHEGKTSVNSKCEVCNKQFISVRGLKEHISRVHEGKKPPKKFKCDLCDTACVNRFKLKVHINAVHERKKPFQCNFCEKSFKGEPCLTKHVSKFHANKNRQNEAGMSI